MVGVGGEIDAEEVVGGFAAVLVRLVSLTIERDDATATAKTDAEFTVEIEVVGAIEIVGAGQTTKSLAADLAVRANDAAIATVGRVGQWVNTGVAARDLGRPAGEAIAIPANLTGATFLGVATTTASFGSGWTLGSLPRRRAAIKIN